MEDVQIFPTSIQWTYVQFRLQLILSHPNIQLVSVTKNNVKLNQNYQSFFKIDAALDLTNSDQQQIWRLKTCQEKGVIFKCGRIQQPVNYQDSLGKQKNYKVIMFKIAVNQLYPIVKNANISSDDLISFTQKYDSIYLCNQSQQMTVYEHQYILRSTKQYLWQYQVQYKYINPIESVGNNQTQNKIAKWDPENIKCEQCQQKKAVFYCLQEKQLFCSSCFDQNHKGKNRTSHRKELITPFNCHKKCPKATHAGNLLQFYCFNCKQIKCQKCLNDNIHYIQPIKQISGGLKGSSTKIVDQSMTQKRKNHESISVIELSKLFKQKQDQLNEEIKIKISNKIRQIQVLINSIKIHFSLRLQQIQEKLKQQILLLKQQSTLQMNKAVGLHTQLKRKYDQFLWIQKFVQYNQEVLDAQSNIKLKEAFAAYVEFINAQDYFVLIDKKIVGMKTFF